MKTILLILAVSITLFCFGQEGNIRVKTIDTKHGSFTRLTSESMENIQGSSEERYALSIVKTSDGGTASFINFVPESKNASAKNEPNTAYLGNVSVYPNPTNGDMTIKYFIPHNQGAEFVIYDLAGKKIKSYLLVGENNQISISEKELHPGVYFYNVLSNGKIVKQDKIVIIK